MVKRPAAVGEPIPGGVACRSRREPPFLEDLMRALALLAAASLTLAPLTLSLATPAWSQASGNTKSTARPGAAETTRYVTIFGEMMGDLPSDAVWRETRKGDTVVSAVLDVCYSVSASSRRKDRFVVTLHPESGKLIGTGRSEPGKVPVAVSLGRTQDGDTIALSGTIRHGDTVQQIAAEDLTDMSEDEYREQQTSEDEIVAEPESYAEVSPIAVAARVSRDSFLDVVKSLRGKPVRVDYTSLVENCADLRTGHQTVRLEVSPTNAPAVVKDLQGMAGVESAGWTSGAYVIERAVRVPAGGWRDGDALKKDALATKLSASLAAALSAKSVDSEWDAVTDELTLRFERPDQAARGLDLSETIEVTLLVGPEKPGDKDNLVIWIGETSVEPVDHTSGAQLAFTGTLQSADEETAAVELDQLLRALAKDLAGKSWDPDESDWK